MINIRGVNVYPAAIESVVHRFTEVMAFRSIVSKAGAMPSIRVELEVGPSGDTAGVAAKVAHQLREALGLTVPVHVVQAGTLPRFEMKAVRFVVEA